MNKYEVLYEKVKEILAHARYQEQITNEQETILLTYLEDVKEEIDKD